MDRDILNTLLIEYRHKRESAEKAAEEKRAEVIASVPELFTLYDSQAELFFALGSAELSGDQEKAKEIAEKIESIENKINALQKEKDIDPDSIKPEYECTVCNDTGFAGGKMCSCLNQKYIDAIIKRSGMKETGENFETFREDIIPEIPVGRSNQRKLTIKIKDCCKKYADSFPKTEKNNILLIGKTGLGKSFLLNSVAKEVINSRHTVLKTTAYNLIDKLLASFNNPNISNDKDQFFSVDLLIIDDLGSEPLIKNVTIEHLFSIINERTANNMHTLYSTNLGLKELQLRYGDRLFSRLIDQRNTFVLKLEGQDLRSRL